MATVAPAIRKPTVVAPVARQTAMGNTYGLPLRATAATKPPGAALTIAKPPTPRQTPTGGAQPTLAKAAVKAQTGGTGQATAPRPPAAKPPVGAGRLPDTNPVGRSSATSQASTATQPGSGVAGAKTAAPLPGAPPGTPNTTPTVPNPPVTAGANPNPIPLVPADQAAIAAANATYGASQAQYQQAMQNAALAYGDPNLMAQWGLPAAPNPNSALALAALRAQQQTQTAENARARTGTFFSSLMGQDLGNIGSAQQRADLLGQQRYNQALANFNINMNRALTDRTNAVNAALADQVTQAANNWPTPDTATGSFAPGNVASPTPRTTAVKTPTVAKGAKAGAPKAAKVPAIKSSTVKSKSPTGLKVASKKK